MRGDLALLVLFLTPALIAPKGCYYGSDVVPLGYNAAGAAFGDAGAPTSGDAGNPDGDGVPDGASGCGNLGSAGGTSGAGGTSSAGGTNSAGAGGGHGGSTVIVLRPH